jgi:hypothetical protein
VSITITDPELIDQLLSVSEVVEVKDASGRVLGTFAAEPFGKPPPGFKSPFTDEQLDEFAKQRTGRPLADILRDLEKRARG